MSLLSSDILHQVFKFFISNNQIVDGESIRVASLVCKQWWGIADSRSLWATPVGRNECHGSNDDNDNEGGDSHSHKVHRSLQIREQGRDSFGNENSLQASFIGFVNLKCYGDAFPELHFFVRERATGSKLLLSISRGGQKAPSLIRDVYVNHFELKEDFLLQDNNNTKSETFFPLQRFPLGITVWKGRVIRWYRSATEIEARDTIDQISSKREILLYQDLAFTEREKRFSFVRHLFDLENNSSRDRNDGILYAEGRQHMVDWVSDSKKCLYNIISPLFVPLNLKIVNFFQMAEIVECFTLEDRTIFQAMLLFDKFITSHDQVSSIVAFIQR
jgi:hypothetical protein